MQGNYWAVQIEKNEQGKVRLKFCGYFYVSAKQMSYLIAALAAFGFAISYLTHYFH